MLAGQAAILQADGNSPTALAIVVGLILVGVLALAAIALWDRLTGAYRDEAGYQLVRVEEGLVLAPADEHTVGRNLSLDEDAMLDLVEAVESRNEMRLHTVVLAGGDERPFERWTREDGVPRAIVIEDSQGLVTIDVAGIVHAQPPLDDAVRGDLLEVFGRVLDGPE